MDKGRSPPAAARPTFVHSDPNRAPASRGAITKSSAFDGLSAVQRGLRATSTTRAIRERLFPGAFQLARGTRIENTDTGKSLSGSFESVREFGTSVPGAWV